MKFLFVTAVILSSIVTAQEQGQPGRRDNTVALFGGMGVAMVNAPEVVEYINSNAAYGQTVDDFATAADFFGGVEIPIGEEWGLKVEYSYLLKSYHFRLQTGGTQELFYSVHAPSVLVQRIFSGEGYFVKMGGGGGYHFGTASQTFSMYGTFADFSSTGVGMKAEIIGQTAFDRNFYGYIGGHLGWEFQGILSQSGTALSSFGTKQLRYFFAGLRFGVTYYL